MPTIAMMIAYRDATPTQRNTPQGMTGPELTDLRQSVTGIIDELQRRRTRMDELTERCRTNSALRASVRLILVNTFYFGMYVRRWAGPDTPYPVRKADTSRKVGTQGKPVSQKLQNMRVRTNGKGRVMLKPIGMVTEGPPARRVNTEGRLDSMEDVCLRGIREAFDAIPNAQHREFVRHRLLVANDYVVSADGLPWPSEDSLFDEQANIAIEVESDAGCVRKVSDRFINTFEIYWRCAYATRPPWSRYEGWMEPLDRTH